MKFLLIWFLLQFFQPTLYDLKLYLKYNIKNFKNFQKKENKDFFVYFLDEYSKRYLEKKPHLKKYCFEVLDGCKKARKIYEVPPVLVFALIENESKGNKYAISNAGACGLTQIIPETAIELGMKIYIDENYEKYKKFWKDYRIEEKNFFKNVKDNNARDIAYRALKNKYMAKLYIEKYKENLRKYKDERFEKGIEKGIELLAYLLKKHKGNILFALAEYNAGPIAKEYGIPPFEETVKYVSNIIKDLQEVGFDKFVIEKTDGCIFFYQPYFYNPYLLNIKEIKIEENLEKKLEKIFLYKK